MGKRKPLVHFFFKKTKMVETPFMHPIVQMLMHVTSPVTSKFVFLNVYYHSFLCFDFSLIIFFSFKVNHMSKIRYQLQARHILKKFKPFQKSTGPSRDTLLHNAKVLKEIEPQEASPKE